MDDQTLEKNWKKLKKLGYTPEQYELKLFSLLTDKAPAGTFDNVYCYQLINKKYHRKLDYVTRNWKPALFTGNNLFIGPSPEMFTHLLGAIKYFETPEGFGDVLILQLHYFALHFYKGYLIRFPAPSKIQVGEYVQGDQNKLVIKGEVQKGGYKKEKTGKFTTRVIKGKMAEFNSNI